MITFAQLSGVLAILAFIAVGVFIIRLGNKVAGFWNDSDGLSITDIIAISIISSYVLFLIPFACKLVKGTLTQIDISLLGQAIIPVTTVLGGYFIDRTTKNIITQKISSDKSKGDESDVRV